MTFPRPLAAAFLVSLSVQPLQAQNLLVNPGFDATAAAWTAGADYITGVRSPLDVAGDPASGSLAVTNANPLDVGIGGNGFFQCVAVTPGTGYSAGAFLRVPSGGASGGFGNVGVQFFTGPACGGALITLFGTDFVSSPLDEWVLTQNPGIVAPATAQSARVLLFVSKEGAGGTRTVLFDDVRLCPTGTCALQLGQPLESAEVPGFRFRVTIETGSAAIAAAMEPACLDETLCVTGSLPGRVEAQLRILGPRPNGYLWFQVVRFTPSRLVVEAEQLSTGRIRHYVLEAVGPGDRPVSLEDRTAFVP